jgi:hypothetical protein
MLKVIQDQRKRCCWKFTARFLIAIQMHLTEILDLGEKPQGTSWMAGIPRSWIGCTKFQDVLMASEVKVATKTIVAETEIDDDLGPTSPSPALLTFQNQSQAH